MSLNSTQQESQPAGLVATPQIYWNGQFFADHVQKRRAHIKSILSTHEIPHPVSSVVVDILVHDLDNICRHQMRDSWRTPDDKVFNNIEEAQRHLDVLNAREQLVRATTRV
jgi:hypothetical protein